MKNFFLLAMLALPLLLGGCYTPLIEGAQEAYDAVRRDPLQADAIALRDEIMGQATGKERARVTTLMKDWRAAPCGWTGIFPSAGNTR